MTAPTRRRRPVLSAPWIEAVAAIIRGTPSLPGAACRGEHDLFDAAADGDPGAIDAAVAICARCPELVACRRWRDGLPRSRIPPGVLAGQIHRPLTRKREGIA